MSVYDVILNNIFKAMEKGIVPWKSPYTARGHRNIDGRYYHGINVFSLNIACWIYGYETPIWLTWKQIKKNNWTLKKGSHGVRVIFFTEIEKKIVDEMTGEEKTETVPVPRYYYVFNLECLKEYNSIKSQFENEPAPPMDNLLKDYIDNSGVKLAHSSYGVSYYQPSKDKIVMAPVKKSAYHQVLAHEIIHSTGHPRRLNRLDNSFFESKERYSFEELIAEIGSSFLLAKMGKSVDYKNTASYLSGWAEWLREQKKTVLFKAAKKAQEAVEYTKKVADTANCEVA